MGDKMRWRYGDNNPVVVAVDPATVIEIGDLVWQDGDHAKPAEDLPCYEQPLDLAREKFAEKFLGVAMQRSRAGDAAPIHVATTGVFEFDFWCDVAELGDFVAPNFKSAQVGGLVNQAVCKVDAARQAIARVAKRISSASNSVLIDIRSTVMTGGIRAGA